MRQGQRVILVELNEINLEFVKRYIARGLLPTFKRLLARHGYAETTSEQRYEDIEPWIQWVTAHTGRSLAEHGVFRLGDIKSVSISQIWETLEAEFGISVGAVCPMNATNAARNPAFFVPDPWTETPPSGPWLLRKLSAAISQAVNDNAQSRLRLDSAVALLAGLAAYTAWRNWPKYCRLALTSKAAPWRKAMFLDVLLSDIFFKLWRRHTPGFSSLFLNAGAHIQHHYMYSSRCYDGPQRNPEWYVDPAADPVLEVYESYDGILSRAEALPGSPRLVIATGLHQDPHDQLTFYWRLRDHRDFLRRAGVKFADVLPRMSRDFLVVCSDKDQALSTERALLEAKTAEGDPIFSVDNRGRDLFVMLEYASDIGSRCQISINGRIIENFREEVVFVAIKNGKHNGVGYVIDSSKVFSSDIERFALADLSSRIQQTFVKSHS